MPLTFDDDYPAAVVRTALRIDLPLSSAIAWDDLLPLEPANSKVLSNLVKKVCRDFLVSVPELLGHVISFGLTVNGMMEFSAGKQNWGYQFRFGIFVISDHDMNVIAAAMGADFAR